MLFNGLSGPIFCADYLAEQYLVIYIELCKVLLGTMVARYFVALVEEAHILACRMIDFWFFVDDVFHALEVPSVPIFLVERCGQSGIGGSVKIEGFLHGKKCNRIRKYYFTQCNRK
jgi:hypothetical protein